MRSKRAWSASAQRPRTTAARSDRPQRARFAAVAAQASSERSTATARARRKLAEKRAGDSARAGAEIEN